MKMTKKVEDKNDVYYLSEKVLNHISKGWLKVKVTDLGERFLCFGTKVAIIERSQNFEIIRMLDGPFRDFIAIAELELLSSHRNRSYFKKIDASFKELTAKVTFDVDKKIVDIPGFGIFDAEINDINVARGTYLLEIPSHPHTKTPSTYLNESIGGSKFAETWFRIVPVSGSTSESFFHFGKISKGCLVVNQLNSWNIIYNHLIRCRLGRLNVGILKIV